MNSKTEETLAVLIGFTIIEAVRAAGDAGVPGGHLYANLTDRITLGAFEDMMRRLVRMKALKQQGQLYFPGELCQ